ncbi:MULTISPECIES: toxin VasX [Xanthomonas]|uniref:toxin VasX n=1 Tax=Xanthomonas TaxID=338 RepID=UPI00044EF7C9|nr:MULTISPECIES: toxin VasX [Xanthomonas]EWC52574.1 hypothetical protein XAR_0010 [Xanthomonas citri pv. glycines str. 8ra]
MNVSVGEIQKASCQFCNKKGLPVLPLRYALARQGMGGAPSVASPFVVAEKEQRKEQFSLPKDLADYTLRTMGVERRMVSKVWRSSRLHWKISLNLRWSNVYWMVETF